MKLFELAKEAGIPVEQLKKELGYSSHLKKLTDEEVGRYLEEKKTGEAGQAETQTVDSAETVVVGEASVPVENQATATGNVCPVDLETLATSLRGAGGKSPYWKWRHLLNG